LEKSVGEVSKRDLGGTVALPGKGGIRKARMRRDLRKKQRKSGSMDLVWAKWVTLIGIKKP